MASIELKGVRKRFGETEVIHGLDIAIEDGTLVVIVGPSGCGKSTLLRMVAGLEGVSEGEITIGGRVVNELEPKDRDIAMVFQNYALYPHMSVFDNMAYGLKIARRPKGEIEERVRRAARMLELEPLLQRRPRQLSGGQRQRVAMGRAIVRDPAAFLFDEPLSNLDAKLRVQMRLEIKQLQRSLGTTSLYVTHDQVEAMTLADRLIVMNEGVAEQIDTPLAVYEHPASIFVAGFIGSPAMNFLPDAVAGEGGALQVAGASLRLERAIPASAKGRPLILGLRPEHLVPAAREEADFLLETAVVETLGADTLVHGRLAETGAGGQSPLLTARIPGIARLAEGELLPLKVVPGALHLFDAESGRRLADV